MVQKKVLEKVQEDLVAVGETKIQVVARLVVQDMVKAEVKVVEKIEKVELWTGEYQIGEYTTYQFKTLSALSYRTKAGIIINVPKGFVTDGASIPRACWSIIGSPFTGKYKRAAMVHDWLYHELTTTRIYADRIFLEIMQERKVSLWKRLSMYRAVRTFGWIPWNRQKKNLGL